MASANCALYCGAKVDFVDIDNTTFTMCPRLLEEKLVLAAKKELCLKLLYQSTLLGILVIWSGFTS